jgi:hypothetical protein
MFWTCTVCIREVRAPWSLSLFGCMVPVSDISCSALFVCGMTGESARECRQLHSLRRTACAARSQAVTLLHLAVPRVHVPQPTFQLRM